MRSVSIFISISFVFVGIATIAFEYSKIKYDSHTVNILYSQKKIMNESEGSKQPNRFSVSLKKKPLNPNLLNLIGSRPDTAFLNQNINEADLSHLSASKKILLKLYFH